MSPEPTRQEMREMLERIVLRASCFGHALPGKTWVLVLERDVEIMQYMRARLGGTENQGAAR